MSGSADSAGWFSSVSKGLGSQVLGSGYGVQDGRASDSSFLGLGNFEKTILGLRVSGSSFEGCRVRGVIIGLYVMQS